MIRIRAPLVDVPVAPDGALLVSDDDGGAIYRLAYAAA
jgi:glucose/arabinose dehydrogenase